MPVNSRRSAFGLIVALPLLGACAAIDIRPSDGDGPPGNGWYREDSEGSLWEQPAPRYLPPQSYAMPRYQPPAYVNPPVESEVPERIAPAPSFAPPSQPNIPPPNAEAESAPARRPAPTPDYDPSGEPCGWWRLCNLWD